MTVFAAVAVLVGLSGCAADEDAKGIYEDSRISVRAPENYSRTKSYSKIINDSEDFHLMTYGGGSANVYGTKIATIHYETYWADYEVSNLSGIVSSWFADMSYDANEKTYSLVQESEDENVAVSVSLDGVEIASAEYPIDSAEPYFILDSDGEQVWEVQGPVPPEKEFFFTYVGEGPLSQSSVTTVDAFWISYVSTVSKLKHDDKDAEYFVQ